MDKKFENFSKKVTGWIGSVQSIITHTIFFIAMFSLYFFDVASASILLILTTVVSLEAIYLSIFIQMTVNKHAEELEDVSEDIDEIQKDVDEIQEGIEEDEEDEMLERIEDNLGKLVEDIIELKKHQSEK